MDEYIDIIDSIGKIINKKVLKSDAHKNGWLHASVHVWFYTDDYELLFQKRSENKIAFPNLWDISVAGHITSGESHINAAVREIKEEIGLEVKPNELRFIGTYAEMVKHNPTFIDNEIHYIYISKLCCSLNKLKIQEDELTDLKLVDINEFRKILKNKENTFVPHSDKYYKFILKEIEEHKKIH